MPFKQFFFFFKKQLKPLKQLIFLTCVIIEKHKSGIHYSLIQDSKPITDFLENHKFRNSIAKIKSQEVFCLIINFEYFQISKLGHKNT